MGREPTEILIVDDEEQVRALLREFFELEGYTVREAKDGAAMRAHLSKHPVSLVTLDVNLPGEDGFTLAREIRAKRNVPIIMISGKSDPVDRVIGLELGADDYITKPFMLREVLARTRAVLRRYQGETERAELGRDEVYRFEGYALSTARRALTIDDKSVELTTAEFNLLELFVKRPGRVMTRDNIMDALKGRDWSPMDRSIDTLVARLRKKVETDSEQPKLIKSVRGVGYVFTGIVERD
jgi:DNA-binding response OmpR family regulator